MSKKPSIQEAAHEAWGDYEPEWLYRDACAREADYTIVELRETFTQAFFMGAVFFISKGN